MKILKDFLQAIQGDDSLRGGAETASTDSAQPAGNKDEALKPEPSSSQNNEILEELKKQREVNAAQLEELKKQREDNAAQKEQEAKNRRYEVSGQPDQNNPWLDAFKNMKAVGNIAGDTIKEGIDMATGGEPQADLCNKIRNSFAKNNKQDNVNVGAQEENQAGDEEMKPVADREGADTPRTPRQ